MLAIEIPARQTGLILLMFLLSAFGRCFLKRLDQRFYLRLCPVSGSLRPTLSVNYAHEVFLAGENYLRAAEFHYHWGMILPVG